MNKSHHHSLLETRPRESIGSPIQEPNNEIVSGLEWLCHSGPCLQRNRFCFRFVCFFVLDHLIWPRGTLRLMILVPIVNLCVDFICPLSSNVRPVYFQLKSSTPPTDVTRLALASV